MFMTFVAFMPFVGLLFTTAMFFTTLFVLAAFMAFTMTRLTFILAGLAITLFRLVVTMFVMFCVCSKRKSKSKNGCQSNKFFHL
ncbi:hypothetical protein AA18895_1125 [Acetobacter ghanensis DSM 18895]|nr:hypothetical protein AA18895_1125 [Acetobacter ghanensis DSM 18895]